MANEEYNKTFLRAESYNDAKEALEEIYEANPDAIVIVEEEGKECIIEHGKELNFLPSDINPETLRGIKNQSPQTHVIKFLGTLSNFDATSIDFEKVNIGDHINQDGLGCEGSVIAKNPLSTIYVLGHSYDGKFGVYKLSKQGETGLIEVFYFMDSSTFEKVSTLPSHIEISKSDYDTLDPKDPNTLYIITE